jgi:hypothetical protein
MLLDKVICAKCMSLCLRSTMRLIRMGRAQRLVCRTCADKRTASWFGGKK